MRNYIYIYSFVSSDKNNKDKTNISKVGSTTPEIKIPKTIEANHSTTPETPKKSPEVNSKETLNANTPVTSYTKTVRDIINMVHDIMQNNSNKSDQSNNPIDTDTPVDIGIDTNIDTTLLTPNTNTTKEDTIKHITTQAQPKNEDSSIWTWADLYDRTHTLIDQAKICSGDVDIYDCSKVCGRQDRKTVSKIKDNQIVEEDEYRFCDKWLIRDMYKQMEELLDFIEKLR